MPTLDCRVKDEGIMSIIEIASAGGAQYADGAVYSYCLGGAADPHPGIRHEPRADRDPGERRNGDQYPGDQRRNRAWPDQDQGQEPHPRLDCTQKVTGIPAEEASSLQYRFDLGGVTLPAYDYGTLPIRRVKIGGKSLRRTDPLQFNMVIDGDL